MSSTQIHLALEGAKTWLSALRTRSGLTSPTRERHEPPAAAGRGQSTPARSPPSPSPRRSATPRARVGEAAPGRAPAHSDTDDDPGFVVVQPPGLDMGYAALGTVMTDNSDTYVRVAAQPEGVSLVPDGATLPYAKAIKTAGRLAPLLEDMLVFRLGVPRRPALSPGMFAWIARQMASARTPVPDNTQGALVLQGYLPTDWREFLGVSFASGDLLCGAIDRLDRAYDDIFLRSDDAVSKAFHTQVAQFKHTIGQGVPLFYNVWNTFAEEFNRSMRDTLYEVVRSRPRGSLDLDNYDNVRHLIESVSSSMPSMSTLWQGARASCGAYGSRVHGGGGPSADVVAPQARGGGGGSAGPYRGKRALAPPVDGPAAHPVKRVATASAAAAQPAIAARAGYASTTPSGFTRVVVQDPAPTTSAQYRPKSDRMCHRFGLGMGPCTFPCGFSHDPAVRDRTLKELLAKTSQRAEPRPEDTTAAPDSA